MASDRHTNYFVHTLLRARDWQHRPQLDAVCDWWRGGGRGVCALVGMGGAGKTAVAERFLRMLPGGLPVDPQVAKDRSLPTPHSTFVFSFYDAANPEAFFEALQMWLEHTPRVQTILSVSQMMFLLQQTPGLIVLDGLERVQHDGQRGDFGRLASPALRDFLNHLAAGNVPELSVLVTSRFPLADLRDKHPHFFRTIAVDQIEVHAGVELLRERGVRGTDPQLAPIVEQCGRHALTVDFAGGYIAEYGQGDPATPLDLGTAEQLQAAGREELDEDRREVLRQGYRFARIAEHYRDAMLDKDEAAMALLERICLFRLGVDALALAAIFTGEQAVEVSGQALAALNAEQLQSKLDWLVRMRIVEATSRPDQANRRSGKDQESPERRSARSGLISPSTLNSQPSTLYAIHPAVRDGFLSGIGRDVALAGHEAVRKGLEVSLGEASGDNPSDPATLDLLEEIVHHTLQSGHVREAYDIHRNRIGGYKNLGWRLGAYERGERICRAFADGQSPESCLSLRESSTESDATFAERKATNAPWRELPEAKQATFINEWALYLHHLGRLAAATHCYELYIETRMRQEDWKNASAGNQNLCDVWLLSGRLSRSLPLGVEPAGADHARLGESSDGALATADEALRLAELAADAFQSCMSYAYRGDARALRGDVPAALAEFRAALEWQHKHEHDTERPLYSNRGYWHTHLLARLGRREEATRLAKRAKEIQEENWGPTDFHIPKYQLVLSSLSVERSASSSSAAGSSADLWTSARGWALARDAKEVLCWSYLVEAQHELAKIKRIQTEGNKANKEDNDFVSLAAFCSKTLASGLKIARDCGYGIYHIDLLMERARLHLLRGDAGAALDDVEVALGDSSGGGGIPANEETGQVELLAANHEACGYAWAIPVGLQLRAEALLLQASQTVGSTRLDRDLAQPTLTKWHLKLLRLAETKSIRGRLRELCSGEAVESPWLPRLVGPGSPGELQLLEMLRRLELLGYVRKGEEPDPNDWSDWIICWSVTADGSRLVQRADGRGVDSARVRELIAQARKYLIESLDRWHDLRDPEPTEDNNFVHPDTGKAYNYRAAETYRVLENLANGVLTGYPLTVADTASIEQDQATEDDSARPQQSPLKEMPLMDTCEIILFAANPAGTGQLALDKEVREIESKIRAAEHRDNLKLISKWAVRPDDLLQALNQHDATIIHFSGHGSAADEIILEGNDGQAKPVSKAAMSALLKTLRGRIRLVILNACFSRPQADGITEHIDCAIGMNKAIGDDAAIIFAASVYRAIGFGKSVQEAFDQGIAALLLEGTPGENTPKLLCKEGVDAKRVYLLNPRSTRPNNGRGKNVGRVL